MGLVSGRASSHYGRWTRCEAEAGGRKDGMAMGMGMEAWPEANCATRSPWGLPQKQNKHNQKFFAET